MQPADPPPPLPTEDGNGTPSTTADSPHGGLTKRKKDESGAADKTAGQKRRRRVFSCQSCQRLKCRCEYDPGAQACHRCVTLRQVSRIECSLKGEVLDVPSHPKPADNGSTSIEERLSRHEKSLAEIKSMVEFVSRQFGLVSDVHRQSSSAPTHHNGIARSESSREDEGPENIADPVDLATASAPTVVLREIGEQVTQGYRRLEHVKLDLVQLQLLDEQTATELVRLFLRNHGHLLLVHNAADSPAADLRQISPFLHSVVCLCAILYREDLCGTPAHRQVYEQVRITLGQTLLSSPLNLEEINAVLIMSDHADGPEYIDSWLLTGYCVKQAMLSISFAKIVNNIKHGSSNIQDRQAIHLWSTVCLHHLHWAATTGRPSVLQTSYINQCNILLSFYQASMQDGMLVAEVLLYSVLHSKLRKRSYLDAHGECSEFKTWKQKWNHLMALPTASMLRIGYFAAYLILAVHALEASGEAMSGKTFLSNMSVDSPVSSILDTPDPKPPTKKDAQTLQAHTAKYAHSVLETFVEMPSFLMDTIPTYLCLCIGYSALILAHYDESQSKVPASVSIGLISRLEQWCMRTPSKSWAIKFAKLARQRVESRIGTPRSYHDDMKTSPREERRHLPGWNSQTMPLSTYPISASGHDTSPSSIAERNFENSDFPSAGETFPIPPEAIHPAGFEVNQPVIPSMEDFFGGGFLHFMGQPPRG
ncbi:uncharacterized protein PG998_013325 [Apiospora kogelbergensis]|uniref:uncharacterized protein n=1 Tax=Apiospora kogelbergensis TaxID=1337665 RepID=UPI00312EE809